MPIKMRIWLLGGLFLPLSALSNTPGELVAPQRHTLNYSLLLEAEYDSNAFATAIEREAEIIYRARPQIGYTRPGTRFDLRSSASVTYNTFQNASSADTFDWNVLLGVRSPAARSTSLTYDLELRYEENEGADRLLGERLQSRTLSSAGSIDFPTGASSSLALRAEWKRSDFSTANSATSHDYNLAARWFYDYSARLGLGAGYRFQVGENRVPQVDQSTTRTRTTGHALFATARTIVSPRLRGSMDVGAQWTESDTREEELSPYVALIIDWQATSKVDLNLSLKHDFGSATEADARLGGGLDFGWSPTERTSITWAINVESSLGADGRRRDRYETGLRFRHALSRVWDYNLGATIGQDRIGTSPDRQRAETYTLSAAVNVRPFRRITVSAGVEYDMQTSESENLDFNRVRARVSGIITF
jgi:hypothetical protein